MGKAINFYSNHSNKFFQQNKISALYIFGDSLSDTGNLSTLLYQASGGQFWLPPSPPLPGEGPYYAIDPYYNSAPLGSIPKVRATDGFNWVDYVSQDTKLPIINFAYTGATTGFDNGLQPFLPSRLLSLPGLANEISSFTNSLGTSKADPKGLYVLWAGANDITNFASPPASPPPSDLLATLPLIGGLVETTITNIKNDIATLTKEGARKFLIPNLPDLGKIPALSGNQNSAFIGTVFSLSVDIELAVDLPKLEQTLKIDIVQPDIYALFQEAINHPQEFGFTNVTDPLIGQNPNDPLVKPSEFLFYDTEHPTTAAQKIVADLFQEGLFKAGYINQGPTEALPSLNKSTLSKELSLVKTIVNGISGTQPLDLAKDLYGLIPDAVSSNPIYGIQHQLDSLLSHSSHPA
jgi:phospholipase/lecithinase/hemolysin